MLNDGNIRIATCVYHCPMDGEMGGRGWPVAYYKWSLFSLFNLGLPITIFYSGDTEARLSLESVIDEFCTGIHSDIDVEIRAHDLTTHPRYREVVVGRKVALDEMNADKDAYPHGFLWPRNEVLCHTKIIFLKEIFTLYPNTSRAVWVDAGIAHWGLIPKCYGGTEIGGTHGYDEFFPHNPESIFSPVMGEGLARLLSQQSMILVGHQNNWYDANLQWMQAQYLYERPDLKNRIDPDGEWVKNRRGRVCRVTPGLVPGIHRYPVNPDDPIDHSPIGVFNRQVVGGLIGVSRNTVDSLIEFYRDLLDFLLDHDFPVFFTEEPILSLYHFLYAPMLIEFSDWHHNVAATPANPCTIPGTFKKSFYKIWFDIASHAEKESGWDRAEC